MPPQVAVGKKDIADAPQLTKIQSRKQGAPHSRKWTCSFLISSILILDQATEATGFRMPIGEFDPAVERSIMDNRVRVQDQDVLAFCFTNAGVVTLREP